MAQRYRIKKGGEEEGYIRFRQSFQVSEAILMMILGRSWQSIRTPGSPGAMVRVVWPGTQLVYYEGKEAGDNIREVSRVQIATGLTG